MKKEIQFFGAASSKVSMGLCLQQKHLTFDALFDRALDITKGSCTELSCFMRECIEALIFLVCVSNCSPSLLHVKEDR